MEAPVEIKGTEYDPKLPETERLQMVKSRLERALPDLERRWAIASLARVAEMDEVPASEMQAMVARSGKSSDREHVRGVSQTDWKGMTTHDSSLRHSLREMQRLTDQLKAKENASARERIVSRLRSPQLRKQLDVLRQQPIISLSGEELDKALRRHEAGQTWGRVNEEVDGITKYSGSVNMGDLFDTFGLEIINGKNTAALLKKANSDRSGATAELGFTKSRLAGKR